MVRVAVAAALVMATGAWAGQSTALVWVSTRVEPQCRVSGATMNFGSYNPVGANATQPLDAETTFDVQCTPGSRVSVTLESGLYPDSSERRLSGTTRGARRLAYELYSDASRQRPWTSASPLSLLGFGRAPQRVRVYGRIPQGQDVPAGSYQDSVLIVVSF
jgi:spore coat protein U-like protein